jgi:hypothetical protein
MIAIHLNLITFFNAIVIAQYFKIIFTLSLGLWDALLFSPLLWLL